MNARTKEMWPVLKYGRTNNIETRMRYYNRKGQYYKLVAFFPCSKKHLVDREDHFKEHSSFSWDWRCDRDEYIEYSSGKFKKMYQELKEISEMQIKIMKEKNGCKFLIFE